MSAVCSEPPARAGHASEQTGAKNTAVAAAGAPGLARGGGGGPIGGSQLPFQSPAVGAGPAWLAALGTPRSLRVPGSLALGSVVLSIYILGRGLFLSVVVPSAAVGCWLFWAS